MKNKIKKPVSEKEWDSGWRGKFMDYDDKKTLKSNTLAKGYVGK